MLQAALMSERLSEKNRGRQNVTCLPLQRNDEPDYRWATTSNSAGPLGENSP
jgi:hypothetical protein